MIKGLKLDFPGFFETEIDTFFANSLLEPSIKFSKAIVLINV